MGLLTVVLFCASLSPVYSCEMNKSIAEDPAVFGRHLSGSCTSEDRQRLAITTEEIFQAFQEGRRVDLSGVTIVGDLMFDQLPVASYQPIIEISPAAQRILSKRNIQRGRIVQGALSIKDSVVLGSWATNLRNEVLMFVGDVHITGTTFQQSIDFSQVVFLKTVNFSHSTIIYESFFIRSHFEEEALFEGVSFGTHSRFHKAQFKKGVSFFESQFTGVAEFLEVSFEQLANFRKTQFAMGAGFSGAIFHGPAIFEEANFTREIYFRFTNFHENVNFQDAMFQEASDFMNAEFSDDRNFGNAKFQVAPNFSGTVLENIWKGDNTNKQVSERLAIALASLGALCFLIWGIRKWRQSYL